MKAFFVLHIPDESFVSKKAIIKASFFAKYCYRQFLLNDFLEYY
jgi:hypothetical protein